MPDENVVIATLIGGLNGPAHHYRKRAGRISSFHNVVPKLLEAKSKNSTPFLPQSEQA
jgi:hypothetical protein